ncbi:MAG TPA: hypothetical protein VEF34_11170, partial [Syntrophobacteraceae bacterium]|nr:hypothetical protein [Syntrophobacteraceae bacterium]
MDGLKEAAIQSANAGPLAAGRPGLFSDVMWTALSQCLVAGAVFVHYYIIRRNWGVEPLAHYSLL